MKLSKILLIVTVVAAPNFATAMGCGGGDDVAVYCQSGTVWDHDSNRCIPKTTS